MPKSDVPVKPVARPPVQPCELPPPALLRSCQQQGAYADCFVAEVDGIVSHAAFVEAFYTTGLFKAERAILGLLAGRPSSDADAQRLAAGASDSFAAWRVEGRAADQILLADFTGRTKSWLMCAPLQALDGQARTSLYFGSAVVPRRSKAGAREMGAAFHALLGFHRLYSRLLLGSARRQLSRVL
ncbi:MAG: hypothetical protein ABIN37_02715 [Burkholderiaceae bacterium]